MSDRIIVACDACGSNAAVVMTAHETENGNRIEWPKAVTKSDGIYFAIDCPKCGQREQRMATSGGTE
jgi:Fe-S-cluster-containing hydrogenase component 2